jgi:uncharacterized protein
VSTSISQYVLKVCSRCDLACDHCYVYEHADQSWHAKPRVIAEATVTQAALRITEHARIHRLATVHVVLHGGEPLLLGHDGLRGVISRLRSLIDPVTHLDLRIHTNGVRLDEELCEIFADYSVQVGVSLDGDRVANDRHRRYSDGRSSYSQVLQALSLLRKTEYRHMYAGLLCTVDVMNDPIAVYQALRDEAPPRVDFLLPHATWEHPPYRPPGTRTPYAAWLAKIHARWAADGRPFPIRYFDSLLAAWEGRPSGSEAVGLDPVDLLVIETDGTWEQTDSLKTAYENAPATGLNVFSHSVDEARAHPGVMARQTGIEGLCATCRECPVVRACGGGLYSHRYRSDNGFDNPSVYCDDLRSLIPRIISGPRRAAAASPPESAPAPRHSLPEGAFDLLAAGPGDRAAMASLAESRWSVVRGLIGKVASGLDGMRGDLGRAAAGGWRLLSALDAEHPEAVREILTYPYVQEWAMRCLDPANSADLDLDHAHLAGLAAAAALRAGIETELILPVRHGWIYLPAIGALAVGAGAGRTTPVRVSPSGLRTPDGPLAWQTVRRVTAGEMSVTVEDLDPFRDCQAWAPSGRLSAGAWRTWRLDLAAAAQQLAAELPGYAAVLSAGLRSVVPMRPGADGYRQSGTARQVFGALALDLPDDVATLEVLLLHEMQHVKLAALSDLFELFDLQDDRRFPVPWRADERPIEGLLQGTYAHLAIADLWRTRGRRPAGGQARGHYRTYRSWVERGIETLLNTGALTPDGYRFVNGMNAGVEAWADDG